jgi:hypothetical protein
VTIFRLLFGLNGVESRKHKQLRSVGSRLSNICSVSDAVFKVIVTLRDKRVCQG